MPQWLRDNFNWLCTFLFPVAFIGVLGSGCDQPDNIYYVTNEGDVYNLGDTDASSTDTDDTDVEYVSYLPPCDQVVALNDLDIDLFGTDGNTFYFEVLPKQRKIGDELICNGGFFNPNQGVYELGDTDAVSDSNCPNWAANVRVVPGGQTSGNITCADSGKVEVDLVGQSSFRIWSEIPNIKLDVGEFTDQKFQGDGEKNLRFNNGQADSTIVREATALRVWRAMNYPAPKTSYARVQSNIWDTELTPGVWAAEILRQQYKKPFFGDNIPNANSVWEGAGDPFATNDMFGGGGGWYGVECDWSAGDDCDEAGLASVIAVVQAAPTGPGFMEATANVVDWPMLYRNQCLAALTGTGDDWIHNSNNVVLVLRDDGKVMYLPYSTDISADHPWYQNVGYDGYAYLAEACHQDPECRLEALLTCSQMITEFTTLNVPNSIVDERCDALRDEHLLRGPDSAACDDVKSYYAAKPVQLAMEIDQLLLEIPTDTGDTGDTGFNDTGAVDTNL